MLKCENCRRHKHSALLTVGNALERRTKRNLGFTEADVSAKQPVHRIRLFHIALYLISGTKLIGRLVIRKTSLKIRLHIHIRRKSVAL